MLEKNVLIVEVELFGQKREVEMYNHPSYMNDARTGSQRWVSSDTVVLARIGHGKKLWATRLNMYRQGDDGKWNVQMRCTVNNRSNAYLQGWNDLDLSDMKRSQHIGQVASALRHQADEVAQAEVESKSLDLAITFEMLGKVTDGLYNFDINGQTFRIAEGYSKANGNYHKWTIYDLKGSWQSEWLPQLSDALTLLNVLNALNEMGKGQ